MIIGRTRKFVKKYKKLNKYQRNQVDEAFELFKVHPRHPKLRNHSLSGKLKGLRSISAAFNLRLIFQEKNDYIEVIFLNVGTHNQVY